MTLRRKAVRLHAFTSTIGLSKILPPVRLSSSLPGWWEQLEPHYETKGYRNPQIRQPPRARTLTAKHCYSMQEVFKRGIGIPLWTDTHVVVHADGRLEAFGHNPNVARAGETHPVQQFPGLLMRTAQHFKFVSPWSFVCEAPMHFGWTHPFYHQPDPFRFHTLPGVVEYRHQHATNINIVLPRREGERQDFDFTAGEFLAYIFPMFDERLDLVVQEVTNADIARINAASSISDRPLMFNRRLHLNPWIPRSGSWFSKRRNSR